MTPPQKLNQSSKNNLPVHKRRAKPGQDLWFSITMGFLMLLGAGQCLLVLYLLFKWNFFVWQLLLWPTVFLGLFLLWSLFFFSKWILPMLSADGDNGEQIIFEDDRLVLESEELKKTLEIPFQELDNFQVVGYTLHLYTGTEDEGLEITIDLHALSPSGVQKLMELLSDGFQKKRSMRQQKRNLPGK